eukprot:CAMPEP_0197184270 /NCGR_PEP_ID=MMETSP1423-20130617/9546_1 /TAXON_ID=476441 /ORGANISM="Pseudo-nitzschia heimii, Strain UNC1101" /LENGTH=525 /DNA_ID=CAMNT_0042635047 /DNA_START=318 /DNA_END=1895 /DNA_ORIENTATION=+
MTTTMTMMLTRMMRARTLATRRSGAARARGIHSRRKMKNPVDLPRALVANFPVRMTRPDKKDANGAAAPPSEEPYFSAPVNSAHAIDLEAGCVSDLDSASVDPATGSITHGRYGELDPDATLGVPLEYLALLRHAAEGAAGLSKMNGGGCEGTVLVYGATQASGFAAVQMAQAAGGAVVGVVDGQHSHSEDMVEYCKGVISEPGTAVGQEYAIAKKNFADLVTGVSTGDEQMATGTASECLEEFKANLRDYAEFYPDTMPAAVNQSKIKFLGMEKDKDQFRANMDTYLSQYQPGSPPISSDQLDRSFSTDQYDVFRTKFWEQTTSVISGDESHFFSPPHIVRDLLNEPETKPFFDEGAADASFDGRIPFGFSPLRPGDFPTGTESEAGGPIAGAILVATPDLKVAASAVESAGTGLREKAEALAFLTCAQRDAFAAATSVAARAKSVGAPVVAIGGSLPGIETAEPSDADVKAALAAMAIQDDGTTDMEYFIQAYRAGDFPFYADYAVHRASEPLAGPRQIVVTK